MPFKEHTGADGKYYSEVEPDANYFIQVQVRKGDTATFSPVCVKYSVDGVDLGYKTILEMEEPPFESGLWEYKDGISTTRAMKLGKPENSVVAVGTAMIMGSVSVKFFEGIPSGRLEQEHCISNDVSSKKPTVRSGLGRKMVYSSRGSVSISEKQATTIDDFTAGNLLDTITIHYCTALGLIHAGVLPKPPLWEEARLKHPLKRPVDPALANLEPEILIIDELVAQDGTQVKKATAYELFDLTSLPDDDDDDDESMMGTNLDTNGSMQTEPTVG